jgi:hypothetical protein
MKNKDIKDINGFKDRIKMLYEYRMVDLNAGRNDMSVQVNEDENEQQQQEPVQPKPQPQVQQPVVQPQQPVAPQPEEKKEDNTELISFLKNEMSRLENVVSSINDISSKVENLGQRMDNINTNFSDLSKAIDEIREPSDIEKLEMRSFDSYPYNKTLVDVWQDKEKSKEEQELHRQGIRKTDDGYEMDYVPMQGMNYNKTDINNQF